MIWFGWVGFYGISTIVGYWMPNPFYTYILNIYDLVWLGWVLWHINHCRLLNAKSFLYLYIRYIWFGLVGFYGISTIVGYWMPNPFYTYILNIYDLVWLGWVLWHINHCRLLIAKSFLYLYIKYIWFGLVWWHINLCRLLNAKSFLYIYIKYIWFGLVWFYGISTIVGYWMPNPFYT